MLFSDWSVCDTALFSSFNGGGVPSEQVFLLSPHAELMAWAVPYIPSPPAPCSSTQVHGLEDCKWLYFLTKEKPKLDSHKFLRQCQGCLGCGQGEE